MFYIILLSNQREWKSTGYTWTKFAIRLISKKPLQPNSTVKTGRLLYLPSPGLLSSIIYPARGAHKLNITLARARNPPPRGPLSFSLSLSAQRTQSYGQAWGPLSAPPICSRRVCVFVCVCAHRELQYERTRRCLQGCHVGLFEAKYGKFGLSFFLF